MTKKNIFDFTFIFLIFLFDRISKFLAIEMSKKYGDFEYAINSFLSINLIWNDGIAFGLFSYDDKFYYNLLSIVILIVILLVFYLMINSNGLEKFGFIMVFGGSLGNIFDRLMYSSVPDFIDFHYKDFNWFIFNVADIFISLGVMLLIYSEFFKVKKYE